MSAEEKIEVARELGTENMGEILAIALEKNAEATKELMCLATFTEPKDFNKHKMVEYLAAILEMMNSEEVRDFFTFYLAPMLKSSSMD